MRYVVRGTDCVYGKSAETKDVVAVAKKAATESKLSIGVKRSAEDDSYETSQKSKKFRLVEACKEEEEDQSCAHPPAAESSAKTTEEEHVSLDEIMHEATLIGATMTKQSTVDHRSSPSAPVEPPLRPLHVTSTLPPTTLAIADHSEEWDEQDEYEEEEEEEEQFAFNYAMGLPIFDTRATDIAKLLGAYDPLEDEHDDEELFGGPLEAFHSSFYEMVGLNANGEETVESDDEEVDSSGDEFDSDEDEDVDDRSEYGDEEIDRSSFIGDDEEQEEWNEHEYSDAELDAEGGVSVSGDEETEETELEGEDERKRKDLYD